MIIIFLLSKDPITSEYIDMTSRRVLSIQTNPYPGRLVCRVIDKVSKYLVFSTDLDQLY